MLGKWAWTLLHDNWKFFILVAVFIGGVSAWSTIKAELTPEQVASAVRQELSKDVAMTSPEIVVLSVQSAGPQQRMATARVMGNVCTLFFTRTATGWDWTEVSLEGEGERRPASAYIRAFREQNEHAAINALQLINTAEVAAQIRNGHFATLDELTAAGFLLLDLRQHPPRGYRLWAEVAGSAYTAYALPMAYPRSGVRSFYTDQTLILRAADHRGQEAVSTDPELENE